MRLINADELKELYSDDGLYTSAHFRTAIDEMPTVSPWHRVEEPPKEEHRTYLVYTDTGYMCSCRWTNNVYGLGESDRWGWSIVDVPRFQKVTHWMPIELPKEDA